MLKSLVYRHNIWVITILLSVCSILASELIIVLLGAMVDELDNTFAFVMGLICPTIIAPVAIYSSLRLAKKLEETRHKVEALEENLKQASSEIEELSGMLPICSVCKKVRDDQGYWSQIESYISNHSDVGFSHGYCPTCYEREVVKMKAWQEKNKVASGG